MSHTPGPWKISANDVVTDAEGRIVARAPRLTDDRGPGGQDDARLIAASPDLLEGAILQSECGYPEPICAYDEECVECWKWTHPDGREWVVLGFHVEPPPPLHPVLAAAIAKAKEGA